MDAISPDNVLSEQKALELWRAVQTWRPWLLKRSLFKDLADDILSDSFLVLYRKHREMSGDNVLLYAQGIVRRVALNSLRKLEPHQSFAEMSYEPCIDLDLDRSRMRAIVRRALSTVQEPHRSVLNTLYFDIGWTDGRNHNGKKFDGKFAAMHKTRQVLKLPGRSLNNLTHRGLQKLKVALSEMNFQECV